MKLISCVAALGAVALLGPALLQGATAEDAATAKAALKDANGMDRPRSRPRRHAECAGGLSGEGALPCFTQPPFTQ